MPCLELGWKTGLEPATLGITIRCSNRLSYIHQCKTTLPLPPTPPGAPGRNRTCNRRLRRPVLYPVELRAPAGMIPAGPRRIHAGRRSGDSGLVGAEGFEPTTSSSQSWRSTRLSYTPAVKPDAYASTPQESHFPDGGEGGARRRPTPCSEQKGCRSTLFALVARPERFELPTTKFVAWCSIQLSYGRAEAKLWDTCGKPSILSTNFFAASIAGSIRPRRRPGRKIAACGRRFRNWRSERDSNPR